MASALREVVMDFLSIDATRPPTHRPRPVPTAADLQTYTLRERHIGISCPHAHQSIQQPVPIIPLVWLIAKIINQPFHVGYRHAERRPRLGNDVLLNHNAA